MTQCDEWSERPISNVTTGLVAAGGADVELRPLAQDEAARLALGGAIPLDGPDGRGCRGILRVRKSFHLHPRNEMIARIQVQQMNSHHFPMKFYVEIVIPQVS